MEARHKIMLTGCHQVARTPPAFFSLELRRPLKSRSTAMVLRLRSDSAMATELPTIPAPTTHTSKRPPGFTRNTLASVGRYAPTGVRSLGTFVQIMKDSFSKTGRTAFDEGIDARGCRGRRVASGVSPNPIPLLQRPGLVSRPHSLLSLELPC